MCVFSQIKDRKHIEQNFHSVARVMPRGWTCGCWGVTMSNYRNIKISDGCVSAQIRKGLGMHLVTYTNLDTLPFLLLVQYKGGLSEIEFTFYFI